MGIPATPVAPSCPAQAGASPPGSTPPDATPHASHFTLRPPTPAPAQLRIYEDEDGARKEEIAALAQPESGSFAAFYDRLKEVKEYYRRFPTTDVTEVRGVLGWDGRGRVGW